MMHSFEVERFFDIKHVGLLSSAEVYLLNLKLSVLARTAKLWSKGSAWELGQK